MADGREDNAVIKWRLFQERESTFLILSTYHHHTPPSPRPELQKM